MSQDVHPHTDRSTDRHSASVVSASTTDVARPPDRSLRFMNGVNSSSRCVARWSAIALGFSVIVSTALNGLLMAVLLVAWLASGQWAGKLSLIRANPVVLATGGLLGIGLLGVLWSQGDAPDVAQYLSKYAKLVLIPILVTVLVDRRDRERGLFAMAAGLALSLSLSYGLWVGLLPAAYPLIGTPDNPTALKNYLTHNVFMAFGVLLFAVSAWDARTVRWRFAWAALALLAAFNVLFMVQGRTGYLVLAALCLVTLFQLFRWRGLALGLVLIVVTFSAAFTLSPGFRERIDRAVNEAEQWDPAVATSTSIGWRLESYRTTLSIIREHPLLGVGTGGFVRAYSERVTGTERNVTRNPHNQYLLTTAELGVVGLAVLLVFFFQHGHASARLPYRGDRLLARGLLGLMLVGCLFNSFLLDHNEGVFFCWLTGLLFAGLATREVAVRGPG